MQIPVIGHRGAGCTWGSATVHLSLHPRSEHADISPREGILQREEGNELLLSRGGQAGCLGGWGNFCRDRNWGCTPCLWVARWRCPCHLPGLRWRLCVWLDI